MCCSKVPHLKEYPEWKTRVQRHIAALVETAPTLCVELAGKGNDSVAIMQVRLQDKPYEMWEYLFHYNQL